MSESTFDGIHPTFVSIDQEVLRSCVNALQIGLEHAQSVRSDHDIALGRTTRKNNQTGQALDSDVKVIAAEVSKLRKLLGWDKEEKANADFSSDQ